MKIQVVYAAERVKKSKQCTIRLSKGLQAISDYQISFASEAFDENEILEPKAILL